VHLGEAQHASDPGTRLLLAELDPKDIIVDGRASNLSLKFSKLHLGNLEVRVRVFALEIVTGGSALEG
jgi:hypothetical protein